MMMENAYKIGDLVWAKMKTYAPWPGRVATPNDKVKKPPKGSHYFIYFFGSKDFAWIKDNNISNYDEFKDKYSHNPKSRALREAIEHIEDYIRRKKANPEVPLEEDNDVVVDSVGMFEEEEDEFRESEEEEVPVKKTPKPRKSSITKNKVANSAPRKRKSEENGSSPLPPPKSKGAKKSVFEQEVPRVEDSNSASTEKSESDASAMPPVFGLFGLGIMGSAILKNLVTNGYKMNVWTRLNKPKTDELLSDLKQTYPDNIQVYDDAYDVLHKSNIIISCVSDPTAVKEVIYGSCGLLDEIELNGKGYVEMATVDPDSSIDVSKLITSKGGRYLEAQMQGSRTEAETGNLIILGAGDQTLFKQCQCCFKTIAKAVFYLGEVGYACKMNLALQAMKSVALVGLAEGLALAESAGISIGSALELFELTGLNCQYLNEKAKSMTEESYKDTHQSLDNVQKDLRLALQVSDTLVHPLLMTAKANEVCKRAKSFGYGKQDAAAVFVAIRIDRNNRTPSPEPVKITEVDQLP